MNSKGQLGNVGIIGGIILTLLIVSFIAPFISAILFDAGSSSITSVNSTNSTLYNNMMTMQVDSFDKANDSLGILFSVLTLGAVFSIIGVIGLRLAL